MRKLYSIIILLSIYSFAKSQTGSIAGQIRDSSNKKILPLATATVFKAKDTSIVTYRLSGPDGEFKIPNLPLDIPLRLIITYSGYNALRTDFTLSANHPTKRIDSAMLSPTSKQLDEVIVIAERPPVIIKKDTIEFNATAFKTLPNALVEDLLKKLPGVMVDADGNITVNGKPVNKILVDGKSFFGDDPKMATRNLPANLIDKVQVTDDKEELMRRGDDNINAVGKVVNITFKKGVKKGLFGKIYAGGGTSGRYESGGIINTFRDTLQLSILGYGNNLNKVAFNYSDVAQTGGFNRSSDVSGSRSTSIWTNSNGGSGMVINGISFGGMQGSGGIATSKGVGFNLNHAPNLKKSFYAQYFYGNVLNEKFTETSTATYNSDTVLTNGSTLNSTAITNAHNIGIGMRLKPDSVTNIAFTANYTIGLLTENMNTGVAVNNNKLGGLSNGNVFQNNHNNSYNYQHSFLFYRLSKTKKDRRFSFANNFTVNNKFNSYLTNSNTHFIYPSPYDSILQQLRNEGLPQTTAFTSVAYSEPITKKIILRLNSTYEYSKLNNSINTYNKGIANEYDKLNGLLSNELNRETNKLNFNPGIEFKFKSLTVTPGLSMLWQTADNHFTTLSLPIQQNIFNVLPRLNILYKQASISYNKSISLPAYTYLMPVANNTNPYYIVNNNPNLAPTESHNINANLYLNNTKKLFNISFNGGLVFSNNTVVQSINVDDKGIQTTTPVNANGSINSWINYNLYKQYKYKNNFSFSWNAGAWLSYNKSRLLYNGDESWQEIYQVQQWYGTNFNFNDKFEWNNRYGLGYNFSAYTNNYFKKLNVSNYSFSTEIIIRYLKHVILESKLDYSYNSNIPAGLPKSSTIWNAAINFMMLKDDRGVFKLSVFDILNKNNYIYSYVNRNMIISSYGNALNTYFMATFTYNIRAIGAKKQKVGGEKLFNF